MTYTDAQVIKLFKKHRAISKRGLSAQYDNTTKCQAYYDADDSSYSDYVQFTDTVGQRKKALVNFNDIQSIVDSIVGFAAQNRRQAKYTAWVAQNEGQAIYSKKMNALYTYHRNDMNADQVETDQDADMFICGYGGIDTDLSYMLGNSTSLPNGQLTAFKLDPSCMYWDPSDKSKNLIKARWTGYWKDFDLKEALNLFQDSKEEDFEAVDDEDDITGYHYNPFGGLYDKIKQVGGVEWVSEEQELVRVFNHQWMDYETFYIIKNPLYEVEDPMDALFIKAKLDLIKSDIKPNEIADGIEGSDLFDFDPLSESLICDEKTKSKMVKEFGDLIDPVSFVRDVYYSAIISGGHVFKWFKSASQQGYSIKIKTGIYNETEQLWRGMVNPMIEPSKYKNKALTELIFTIAANSKGGVMVERGAVEDISDFESKWAKTDAVIEVEDGAISGGKIMQKAQGAVPTGLDNIIMLSDSALSKAGVDPSFLGEVSNEDTSGLLFKRRIKQVRSKMARYFDSITLYQKEHARLSLDLIRIWIQNNEGNTIRLTGDDGMDEFVRISQDMLAAQYDVDIQEAAESSEDKQQTASILGTYGDKLIQFNPPAAQGMYAESINMLPLDGDVKKRLIGLLQPQQEEKIDPAMVQQLQQRIQQLESLITQSQVEKTNADAELARVKAKQIDANIPVDVENKQANTVKTLEDAQRISTEINTVVSNPPQETQVNL